MTVHLLYRSAVLIVVAFTTVSGTGAARTWRNGVPPDIFVENTPEGNLAGRDRELETAIQELMKQLSSKTSTVSR